MNIPHTLCYLNGEYLPLSEAKMNAADLVFVPSVTAPSALRWRRFNSSTTSRRFTLRFLPHRPTLRLCACLLHFLWERFEGYTEGSSATPSSLR